jgi:SP family general alpha glucoside:H+ symporter-like MFS transporter
LTSVQYFSDDDVKKNVAMKIHTTELEKKMTSGASYLDMFRGIDRRRTEIVSVLSLAVTLFTYNGGLIRF